MSSGMLPPMPLDPDFVADSLYDPDGMLIDQVLKIDAEESMVRVRMPTHEDLPITRSQRVHPVLHPRHVSGGLMIHMSGVAAYAHFYYVLGLRHSQRWTGYGVRIHSARYHNIASIGEPLIIECKATHMRKRPPNLFVRYKFVFNQGERLIYEGDQSAMWMQVPEG
jgi:hypothetical protein